MYRCNGFNNIEAMQKNNNNLLNWDLYSLQNSLFKLMTHYFPVTI